MKRKEKSLDEKNYQFIPVHASWLMIRLNSLRFRKNKTGGLVTNWFGEKKCE